MLNKWLNKYDILKDEDKHDLERQAAMFEFGSNLPREHAEQLAHQNYIKVQHYKAAAHHLDGVKLAKQQGRFDDEKRHLAMYILHMDKLGRGVYDAVPTEVIAHKNPEYNEKSYMPHPADRLATVK